MQILGVDVGGSGIKGAPVDTESGELLADRLRIPTPQPAKPKSVAAVIREIAEHFEWSGAIGCAVPARVKGGVTKTAANIHKSFVGTDFGDIISKQRSGPVSIINDADAAGIAEMRFGAGRGRNDLVLLLTIGTGIGSALFIEQTLVPNTEFGHLDLDGRNAENYTSDQVRKRKELSWKDWARRFQRYLDHIEFILSPDLIIIGGGISKPQRAEEYMRHLKTECELTTAVLQNEAGIIGAALCGRRVE